jgi:hypothetical protein
LQVWDNTTPSQPSLIGTSTIDTTFTDQVVPTSSGPIDFTDHDIALSIDDSILNAPTLRSRFTVPVGVDVEAAAVDGHDLFLAEGAYGFNVVDSASFDPVAHFEAPISQGALLATDLDVSGNRAVLVSAFDLIVADVSDRQSPVESGRVAIDSANRVVTRGDNAYVTSKIFGELSIFDIADPENVRSFGVLSGVYANDLVVRGRYAYMAAAGDFDGSGGLRIADISDENAPTLVGSYFGCGALDGMAVAVSEDGATTYVGCEDGTMRILDTRDVASPALLGTYVLPDDFNACISIALRNARVYIGHAYGVDEVDVVDPSKPLFVDRLPTHWQVNRVYAPEDGSVFAITGLGGIYRFGGEVIFANGFE